MTRKVDILRTFWAVLPMGKPARIALLGLVYLVILGAMLGCNATMRAAKTVNMPARWNPAPVMVYAPAAGKLSASTTKTHQNTPESINCIVSNTQGLALNLRSCPGMDCSIITALLPGDKLAILATNGSWYKARAANLTGWVHSDYCEVKNE